MKKQSGITLIALIITIVILAILTGVAINATYDTGILQFATNGAETHTASVQNENQIIDVYEKKMEETVEEFKEKEKIVAITVPKATDVVKALNMEKNVTAEDKYGNTLKIPAGFGIAKGSGETVPDGIVIEDVSYTETRGSQFVWIPVGIVYTDVDKTESLAKTITLKRRDYSSNIEGSDVSDTRKEYSITDAGVSDGKGPNGNNIAKDIDDFKAKTEKSKGYYIGRYEARKDSSGKLVITASDTVWSKIKQSVASTNCQNMYSNVTFTSDLINSYAWDTALYYFQKCGNNAYYSRKNSVNTTRSTTGTTTDVICNVYDMASNDMEWSTEANSQSGMYRTCRGGWSMSQYYYAYGRLNYPDTAFDYVTYRPILYL